MLNHRKSTKEIAKRVVTLIGEGGRPGLDEALSLLNTFYPGRPQEVARAYETACLIVMKRLLKRSRQAEEAMIAPDADWLAIQAAQSVREGNMGQAFGYLRIANSTGASRRLCRNVVFEILRGSDNSDRVTELHFTPKAIISIEVGRVKGSGLVILVNSPSPRRVADWRDEPKARAELHELGSVSIRNLSEISADVARGAIEYSRTGNSAASLSRINWMKYLRMLAPATGGGLAQASSIAA